MKMKQRRPDSSIDRERIGPYQQKLNFFFSKSG
jgi:hypothetical protein